MGKPRLKGLLHVSDNRGEGDYTVGRVVKAGESGEILGAGYGKLIFFRNHYSFLVQMIGSGHLNAASGYAEGRVLYSLEFLNQG